MLNDMIQRMLLEVPGIASSQAKIYINEALTIVYNAQMWSWQLQTAGFLTPGLLFPGGPGISAGSVTVNSYSNIVTGDAAATAAWNAYNAGMNLPLFTQLQFRSPFYSLYSIIGFGNGAGGGYGVGGYGGGGYGFGSGGFAYLVLDRPWMEPSMVAATYMAYQAYFPVPVSDFKRFLWARDTTNNFAMDYTSYSQRDLAIVDPERTIFDDPVYFVPYQVDQRPGSATFGNLLIELWPQPLSVLPYTFGYLRRGPLLQKPTDTLPYPLTEEVVLWRAKEVAFLYKEAQKGEQMERGQGANWQFLIGEARDQFKIAIKPVKDVDQGLVELYFNRMQLPYPLTQDGYATVNGQLNIGGW